MPGGFFLANTLCNPQDVGVSLGANYSAGTTVAPSATANTKGAWVQLIAATVADADAIVMHASYNLDAAGTSTVMFDIGIGGAGSERAVIPNLFCICTQYSQFAKNILLPLHIPRGSRIAARCQSTGTSSANTVNLQLTLYSAGWTANEGVAGYDNITTLSAAPPVATVIQPLTAATKTAWVQVIAATVRDYCGLLISVDNQATTDGTGFPNLVVDVGVGGAGTEQVIVANLAYNQSSGAMPYEWLFIPVEIKAGSRVAVRGSFSTVTAAFKIGMVLYGAYQ